MPRLSPLAVVLLPMLVVGCASQSGTSTEPTIWAGAMQDETYEVKGKPQSGGGVQAGYGGPGGEVNPQSLEAAALNGNQVHYHYHVHNHYHHNGMAYSVPGYAHATYMVPHNAPMPAYVSPYAHSPNGGNPVGPQGNGPWNQPHNGWGTFNPWLNNGAGGLEGIQNE